MVSKGKHKLWMSKSVTEEGNDVIVSIKVNPKLQKLIKKCSAGDGTYVDHFAGSNFSRYLIKNVLRNSLTWRSIFTLLFSKDIIEKGKGEFEIESLMTYNRLREGLHEVKDLIYYMEQALDNGRVSVTCEVK